MAAVTSGKSDFEQMVRVKYIPISSVYKGAPLPISVTGDDGPNTPSRTVQANLRPGQWMEVPVAIAKQAMALVKKQARRKNLTVPDGEGIEDRMASRQYDAESQNGVRYTERHEYEQPDFEIVVDGKL